MHDGVDDSVSGDNDDAHSFEQYAAHCWQHMAVDFCCAMGDAYASFSREYLFKLATSWRRLDSSQLVAALLLFFLHCRMRTRMLLSLLPARCHRDVLYHVSL
jgi:hypothetical protein